MADQTEPVLLILLLLCPTLHLSCKCAEKVITLNYENDLMFYPRQPLLPVALDPMWEILGRRSHVDSFCF